MKKILYLAFVILCSCATGYQSSGFKGGFTQTRLDEQVYRISFQGNGWTSTEKVSDFTLMKAAELTAVAGYAYFVIMDSQDTTQQSTYKTQGYSQTTGTVNTYGNRANVNATTRHYGGNEYLITKPGQSIMIYMLKQKPADRFAFDAAFVYRQMYEKWDFGK